MISSHFQPKPETSINGKYSQNGILMGVLVFISSGSGAYTSSHAYSDKLTALGNIIGSVFSDVCPSVNRFRMPHCLYLCDDQFSRYGRGVVPLPTQPVVCTEIPKIQIQIHVFRNNSTSVIFHYHTRYKTRLNSIFCRHANLVSEWTLASDAIVIIHVPFRTHIFMLSDQYIVSLFRQRYRRR